MKNLESNRFNEVKKFINDEKLKLSNVPIELRNEEVNKYLESIARLTTAIDSYSELCVSQDKYSMNENAIRINKLMSAAENCSECYKRCCVESNDGSAQVMQIFDTTIASADEIFNSLALKMIGNMDCEENKTLGIDPETFFSFDKE